MPLDFWIIAHFDTGIQQFQLQGLLGICKEIYKLLSVADIQRNSVSLPTVPWSKEVGWWIFKNRAIFLSVKTLSKGPGHSAKFLNSGCII